MARKPKVIIGEVPGIPERSTFTSRDEARERGVHRARIAGIVGTKLTGAESVVASGGYEDDEDEGSWLSYTGHGGRDDSGKQVRDQSFDSSGNAALLTSMSTGAPVRLIRGVYRKSRYAPKSGCRYDGLFRVVDAVRLPGKSGHLVCKFRPVKLEIAEHELLSSTEAVPLDELVEPAGNETPERVSSMVRRLKRVSGLSPT